MAVLLHLVDEGDGEVRHRDGLTCRVVPTLHVGACTGGRAEGRGGGEEGLGHGLACGAVEVEHLGKGQGLALVVVREGGVVHEPVAFAVEQ